MRTLKNFACMRFVSSMLFLSQSMPMLLAAEPTNQVISDGTHTIDASTLAHATSLTVSKGATAIIDVSNVSNVVLPGDFTNNGSVYFGSTVAGTHSATLSAANIYNH